MEGPEGVRLGTKPFQLEIVTPTESKFHGQSTYIRLPGVEGEMGVLSGHAPLLTILNAGVAAYETDEERVPMAIGEGFASITANKVVCLVDFALRRDEIDEQQARQRHQEVLQTLQEQGESADLRAQLQAAWARVAVFERS